MEKITPKSVIGCLDLAFGHTDGLVRLWFCSTARKVFDIQIYHARECQQMGIAPKAYDDGLARFFTETAAMYPGAPIIYDANSETTKPVEHLIPRHLRVVGIKKNNAVKTGLVTTLIELMADVDSSGVCRQIGFPHPDASWLSAQQRRDFAQLYREMVGYQRTVKIRESDGQRVVVYNKPAGGTDDALDTLVLLMSQIKPVRKGISLSEARRRAAW